MAAVPAAAAAAQEEEVVVVIQRSVMSTSGYSDAPPSEITAHQEFQNFLSESPAGRCQRIMYYWYKRPQLGMQVRSLFKKRETAQRKKERDARLYRRRVAAADAAEEVAAENALLQLIEDLENPMDIPWRTLEDIAALQLLPLEDMDPLPHLPPPSSSGIFATGESSDIDMSTSPCSSSSSSSGPSSLPSSGL